MAVSFNPKDYYVSEIGREEFNKFNSKGSVSVPIEGENPFSTQRVTPVERTSEAQKPEQTNRYVQNQNLFASLNSIGTGELSPKKYDEFTGNKLDMFM